MGKELRLTDGWIRETLSEVEHALAKALGRVCATGAVTTENQFQPQLPGSATLFAYSSALTLSRRLNQCLLSRI